MASGPRAIRGLPGFEATYRYLLALSMYTLLDFRIKLKSRSG